MLGDIRHSLRQYSRAPGFATAAILTLALGIGANTTIFSVADAVLFRPLPYPQADRLVLVWEQLQNVGALQHRLSASTLEAYRADATSFEATAAFREDEQNLVTDGIAGRVSVIYASAELLGMLGAQAAVGRLFMQDDWRPENNRVALISHRLFVQRFGADPQLTGKAVRLDDQAYTIIGVLKSGFEFSLSPAGAEVWIPQPPIQDRVQSQFAMLARLQPGVGPAKAREAVSRIARRLNESLHPHRGPNGEDIGYRATVIPLQEQLLGDFKIGALVLSGAVGLVLLIACANVASLLLERTMIRERETAVRMALGATRGRLIRQWINEAAVLTVLGGSAAILVSHWGLALLEQLSPLTLPAVTQMAIDGRAMIFTFAISAAVCLLFGLVPMLLPVKIDIGLRQAHRRSRAFDALVVAEVALALMLLVGAGLLLQSLVRLRQINPGFRADHLLTMQVQLSAPRYEESRSRVEFFSMLRQRIAALPRAISVSTVSRLPIGLRVGSLEGRGGNPFSLERSPWNPNTSRPQIAHTQTIGLDYFRTMEIPLLAGRDFSDLDTLEAPPAVIINETLARRYFPGSDALGQRLLLGAPEPGAKWMTIVGVVADIKSATLDQPPIPQFYVPEMQDAPRSMKVVLRTLKDPQQIAGQATAIVRSLDPEQPVSDVVAMDERIDKTLGHPRFQTILLTFFAGSALLLAAIGIYGVVAQATIRRTHEIGIRMALGADATKVVRSVLTDGLRPVAFGIVIGLFAAAMLARFLSSVLFEVSAYDAATFMMAAILLAAIAAVACAGPARRAARVDPLVALRHE